jgi:hypothetical protein
MRRWLKETLEVFDLVELQSVCLPDGGEKDCLRGLGEEFEQFMSYFHRVLTFRLCLIKEAGGTFIHSVDQLINSLGFEVGGDLKQSLPMGGMFDLLFSVKRSWVGSDAFALHPDLQMFWIDEQFTRSFGEGRGNRVTIRIKLDKAGFTDLCENQMVGRIRDLRKGYQFLFLEQIDRPFLCGPMNPLVSLQTPRRDLEVDLSKILTGSDSEQVLDVSDHPFHASLLIGSPRCTGMDGKSIVSHKV